MRVMKVVLLLDKRWVIECSGLKNIEIMHVRLLFVLANRETARDN